jgi:hypothetical protein
MAKLVTEREGVRSGKVERELFEKREERVSKFGFGKPQFQTS